MKCPQCSQNLIWQEEYSYDDFMIDGDGIIGVHQCHNQGCGVYDIYIFTPIDAEM